MDDVGVPHDEKRLRFQSFPYNYIYICSIDFYSFSNMVTTFCFHISTICFLFFLGTCIFIGHFSEHQGSTFESLAIAAAKSGAPRPRVAEEPCFRSTVLQHGAASSITSNIYICNIYVLYV